MDIVEFLTSKEIIVVYIVAAVACLLCFIIYLVEKHNDRGRKRHNTKTHVATNHNTTKIQRKLHTHTSRQILRLGRNKKIFI